MSRLLRSVGAVVVAVLGFRYRLLGVCYGCFLRLAGAFAGRSRLGCVPMSGRGGDLLWALGRALGCGREAERFPQSRGAWRVGYGEWMVYACAEAASSSVWPEERHAEACAAVEAWRRWL